MGGLAEERRQNYSEVQVKQISGKIVKATDKAVFVMHSSAQLPGLYARTPEETTKNLASKMYEEKAEKFL